MTTSNKLTKKELNQVFWRSFGLEWSWNYERQMNMSYCYSMLPVIKKLYPNKEDQVAAMKRHLEFFNTTPQLATLLVLLWKKVTQMILNLIQKVSTV